jgi:hypothetical protein
MKPVQVLSPITLVDRGDVVRIHSKILISNLPRDVHFRTLFSFLPFQLLNNVFPSLSKIADMIERAAQRTLKKHLPDFEKYGAKFEIIEGNKQNSIGQGVGIMYSSFLALSSPFLF